MKEDLQLKTKVKVANPADLSRYKEVDLIIDADAAFSVIRKDKLQDLSVPIAGKKKLQLADGKIIERDYGGACFIIDGKGTGWSDVIFGEETDTELLGPLTLESMALNIDTKTGELKPIKLFLL